jgi:SSS family solute:Na+ symporter
MMLLKYTPVLFASMIIAGALAAAMSTGDSQLHAISTLVSTDIYKKYINKNADAHHLYGVAKFLVVVFGIISIIIALQKPGLLGNILAVSNGGVAVLAPAMVGGLYWKRATKYGALWSIILGETALIITTFIIPSPLKIMPGLWGLMVAFIAYFLISLATVPDEKTVKIIDSINEFFGGEKLEVNAH